MDITQVAKVDIQPDKTINEALPNLVKYEPVSDNNIGLQRIYELLDCNSKMFQPVWLGKLRDNNELHYLVDEEGLISGQWKRGVMIKNEVGEQLDLVGNGIFVKSTPDGEYKGWTDTREMADDLRKYTSSIKLFDIEPTE